MEASELSTVRPGETDESLFGTGSGKVSAARVMLDVVRLSRPQFWTVAVFVGIYITASAVQMGALACFNAGFSLAGTEKAKIDKPTRVLLGAVHWIGLPANRAWIAMFVTFFLLGVGTLALDHLGRVVRLRLLSTYQANQIGRGLTILCQTDPREIGNVPRRELIYAVRGDCRSMRVLFQVVLQVAMSLVQTVGPFLLIFTLDMRMSMVGLGALLLGIYPVYLLGKKTGRMTFHRFDAAIDAGAKVSSIISGLRDGSIAVSEKKRAIEQAKAAVQSQQLYWRKQYQIRSLCEKSPAFFSYVGTFTILMLGVVQINSGALNWQQLMTFILATRMVFSPFSSVGNQTAKGSENLLRAARHLYFVGHFSPSNADSSKEDLPRDGSRVSVSTVEFRNLALQPSGSIGPLNLSLRRGDALTLVDPLMGVRNPVFQYLSGAKYVSSGEVLLAGRSVNRLQYEAIQSAYAMTRIASDGPGYVEGTLVEIMRTFHPTLGRQEAERFAINLMGSDVFRSLPEGIDTHLRYRDRHKGDIPLSCYWLVTLFRNYREGRSIQVLDSFEKMDESMRAMMERFVASFRDEFIFVWMDRKVRPDISDQHILAFRNNSWLGSGDLNWFRDTFPDWDQRVDKSQKGLAWDEEGLVLAEEMDDDEAEEEG